MRQLFERERAEYEASQETRDRSEESQLILGETVFRGVTAGAGAIGI